MGRLIRSQINANVFTLEAEELLDDTTKRIVAGLDREPRATIGWLSEHLRIARGTVQNRLSKLVASGSLRPFSVTVRPAALGYPVRAIVTADLDQAQFEEAMTGLSRIPEVLECVATSGEKSLLCHVVARNADDLYRVGQEILGCPGIRTTVMSVVLKELIGLRTVQLFGRTGNQPVTTVTG